MLALWAPGKVAGFRGCPLSPPRSEAGVVAPPPAPQTPLTGFPFSPPLLYPPSEGSVSPSCPCPFPHSSQFCKFSSSLGLHFSTGWKCQGPVVSQESGAGGSEKRAGRRESPLRLGKGSAAQWWGLRMELRPGRPGFSLSLGSKVLCVLGYVAFPLWASLYLSVYREGRPQRCMFSGEVSLWGGPRDLHFYQAPQGPLD